MKKILFLLLMGISSIPLSAQKLKDGTDLSSDKYLTVYFLDNGNNTNQKVFVNGTTLSNQLIGDDGKPEKVNNLSGLLTLFELYHFEPIGFLSKKVSTGIATLDYIVIVLKRKE